MKPLWSGPKPFRLDLLKLSPNLRVTVLAPHPDDFDAIGATMRKLHENGNPIHLAVLSACSGVEDSFCPVPTLEAKAAIREQEQRESCRFFGLSDACLEFPRLALDAEGQPAENPENTGLIQDLVERSRADLVFLPHGNDTNAGHRQTYAMFRQAATGLGRPPVTGLYNHDPKTISARIDALMLFNEEWGVWKGELLRFHRSQQHRNLLRRGYGLDHRILEVNRQLAARLGFPEQYAEAFAIEAFAEM